MKVRHESVMLKYMEIVKTKFLNVNAGGFYFFK